MGRVTVAAAAATLLLAGCGGVGAPTAEPPDGDWVLVEGEGPEGPVPRVEGHPITLAISEEEISGTAACNTYGGSAELGDGRLRFEEVFQTEMGCPEDGVMASEAAYLDALRAVEGYARDGDHLELTGESTRLVFEARTDESADDSADEPDPEPTDPDTPVTDEPDAPPSDD